MVSRFENCKKFCSRVYMAWEIFKKLPKNAHFGLVANFRQFLEDFSGYELKFFSGSYHGHYNGKTHLGNLISKIKSFWLTLIDTSISSCDMSHTNIAGIRVTGINLAHKIYSGNWKILPSSGDTSISFKGPKLAEIVREISQAWPFYSKNVTYKCHKK